MAQTAGQSTDLTASPMMRHLLESLQQGKDIGHYGRLTFVMVARYFMDEKQLVQLLTKNPGVSEEDARQMVAEVIGHGYNPPQRGTILKWQQRQDFPICPNAQDPDACDVYRQLQFPDQVYDNIGHFWEEKVEAHQ